ncbi:short-subunit dehydrogenase [Stella humosa]|uniref:Short-subunit dehydrogenase n=1 Tax=Stella humosa TaxID=94 RepID=A0A3N1M9M3_9PROT|nr:SDR family NAD(P)-dependent oxidoreductase [Stella humosa]ROP99928.1 short-subunit dehydrogenase [Stella humosa]BBK30842.1 short-chain dehydrogenase [Stella humosa]
MDFRDRTVMVTGAAGALGRAVAEAFAGQGAALILVDLHAEGLAKAFGQAHRQVAVDITDAARVVDIVGQAAAGGVDVLCNIAGGFAMGPAVHETEPAMWDDMLGRNAVSVLNMARAVVPAMKAQGHGKIVNVAAMAALKAAPAMAAYSIAKTAVLRLTEAMAGELRDSGINVNCVMPSIIDTPANRADMPKADPARWVSREALADVILFLASDRARAIHGAGIPVVGLS